MAETLYIDGKWKSASDQGTWDLMDPGTEEIIQKVSFFRHAADIEDAIQSACQAFEAWKKTNPYDRAKILKKAADRMRRDANPVAELCVKESGKPLAEAKGEWLVAANFMEWFAEECKRSYGKSIPSSKGSKRMHTLFQPLGPVGIITAWNFPAYNPARSLSAALAAGCTVVLKASEYTPLTAVEMVKCLEEAGIPPGVVNLVNGDPELIGNALLNHPGIKKISFTGSTRVGELLQKGAYKTFTKLSLELGGNAPVIVSDKVDVKSLAAQSAISKNRNCGQVCISPQRFIVHEAIADEFMDHCMQALKKLKLGHGLNADTQVGPMINSAQRSRLQRILKEAQEEGAELRMGGNIPFGMAKGFFLEPGLAYDAKAASPLFHQELFGPIMPVTTFKEVEEALAIANRTEYGLAAYVFSNDLRECFYWAEGLEFGMVGVNEWAPQATEAPFIGWKKSGLGAEGGHRGLYEYMEEKLISFGNLI